MTGALMATGFGLQALSSIIGGLSGNEAARYNAAQMREQARFSEAVGAQRRRAALRSYGESLASARAASAASGVAVGGDYDIFGEVAEAYGRELATIEVETEFGTEQQFAKAGAAKSAGTGAMVQGLIGGLGYGASALAFGRK